MKSLDHKSEEELENPSNAEEELKIKKDTFEPDNTIKNEESKISKLKELVLDLKPEELKRIERNPDFVPIELKWIEEEEEMKDSDNNVLPMEIN